MHGALKSSAAAGSTAGAAQPAAAAGASATASASASVAALVAPSSAPSNPAAARASDHFSRELFLMSQRHSYEAAQKAAAMTAGSYPTPTLTLAERRQRRLQEAAAAAVSSAAQPGSEIPLASLVPYPLEPSGPSTPPAPTSAAHVSTSILPPAAPILKPSTPARWTSALGLTLSPGSTAKAVSFAQQLEAVRNIPSRGSSYADDELESVGLAEEHATSKQMRKTPRKKKKGKKHRHAPDEYDAAGLSDRTPRSSRKYATDVEEDECNEEDDLDRSPLTAQLLAAAAQISLDPNEIPPLRSPSPSLSSAPGPLRAPRSSKSAALHQNQIDSAAKLSPTLTAAILEASEQADVAYATDQLLSSSSSLALPSRLVDLQQNRTALFARVASRRTASASSTSSSVSSLLSTGSASSGSSCGSSSSGSISFASSQSSSTAHSPVPSPALVPARAATVTAMSVSHSRYASQGYKQRSIVDSTSAGGRYSTSPAVLSLSMGSAAGEREREREMPRVAPTSHTRPQSRPGFIVASSAASSSIRPSSLVLAVPASASADDTLSTLSSIPAGGKHTPSPPRADASPRGGHTRAQQQQQQQQRAGGAPGDAVPARSPRGAARFTRAGGSAQAHLHAPRVAAVRGGGGSGAIGADVWLEQHARDCADKKLRSPQLHARAVSETASAPRSFLFHSSSSAASSASPAAPLVSRSPKQGYAVCGPKGGFAMGIVGRGAAGSASVVGGSITGTAGWSPIVASSGLSPFGSAGSSMQLESRARSNVPSPRGAASAGATVTAAAANAAATSNVTAPRPSSSGVVGLSTAGCYVSPTQPPPKAHSKRLSGGRGVAATSSSSASAGVCSVVR